MSVLAQRLRNVIVITFASKKSRTGSVLGIVASLSILHPFRGSTGTRLVYQLGGFR